MNEIVKRQTVDEIVDSYNFATAQIEEAYGTLSGAEGLLKAAFGDRVGFRVLPERLYVSAEDAKTSVLAGLKVSAWRALVDLTQIKRVMSVSKAKELDKTLYEDDAKKLPDVTTETVMATMQAWAGNIGGFMDEAVVEIFNWLSVRSREKYKTNDQFRVGRKVVLTWVVERKWTGGGFRVMYQREAEVSALNNVFRLLDGAGASKSHYGELHDAIEASEDGTGETDYFKFRACKNNNLHLEFKRMDLVEQINQIGGDGRSLRKAS